MVSMSPSFQASNERRTVSTSFCDIARPASHLAGSPTTGPTQAVLRELGARTASSASEISACRGLGRETELRGRRDQLSLDERPRRRVRDDGGHSRLPGRTPQAEAAAQAPPLQGQPLGVNTPRQTPSSRNSWATGFDSGLKPGGPACSITLTVTPSRPVRCSCPLPRSPTELAPFGVESPTGGADGQEIVGDGKGGLARGKSGIVERR